MCVARACGGACAAPELREFGFKGLDVVAGRLEKDGLGRSRGRCSERGHAGLEAVEEVGELLPPLALERHLLLLCRRNVARTATFSVDKKTIISSSKQRTKGSGWGGGGGKFVCRFTFAFAIECLPARRRLRLRSSCGASRRGPPCPPRLGRRRHRRHRRRSTRLPPIPPSRSRPAAPP